MLVLFFFKNEENRINLTTIRRGRSIVDARPPYIHYLAAAAAAADIDDDDDDDEGSLTE